MNMGRVDKRNHLSAMRPSIETRDRRGRKKLVYKERAASWPLYTPISIIPFDLRIGHKGWFSGIRGHCWAKGTIVRIFFDISTTYVLTNNDIKSKWNIKILMWTSNYSHKLRGGGGISLRSELVFEASCFHIYYNVQKASWLSKSYLAVWVFHKATRFLWSKKHVTRAVIGQILFNKSYPTFPKASSFFLKASAYYHSLLRKRARLWKLASVLLSETLRADFYSELTEVAIYTWQMWKLARHESQLASWWN